MNILDQIMTSNLKKNRDQDNEAINNEPTFDTSKFKLSSGTSNPLTLVTVSLGVGKKHRAMNVAGITCLRDSGATSSMIKRKYTNHYACKMRSNKVEYSTAAGMYCTTHDVKAPSCMP